MINLLVYKRNKHSIDIGSCEIRVQNYYLIRMKNAFPALALLLLSLAFAKDPPLDCHLGKPVLLRTLSADGTYAFSRKCYCPADYLGQKCESHRKVSCYLQAVSKDVVGVSEANFKAEMQYVLNYTAECYVQISAGNTLPIATFLRNKIGSREELIADGADIVWASDENLFEADGRVKVPANWAWDPPNRDPLELTAE